jgi:hypothetical protein
VPRYSPRLCIFRISYSHSPINQLENCAREYAFVKKKPLPNCHSQKEIWNIENFPLAALIFLKRERL